MEIELEWRIHTNLPNKPNPLLKGSDPEWCQWEKI